MRLPAGSGKVAQLALVPSAGPGGRGRAAGRGAAARRAGQLLWTVASPVDASFAVAAWPGQKARGAVLALATSRTGRLAIVRQDVKTVDLHDLATGQHLTQLTSSRINNSVPAAVAFDGAGRVLTTWALVAMALDKPISVTLHAVPLDRAEALSAAKAALASSVPRLPDGTRRPADPPSPD